MVFTHGRAAMKRELARIAPGRRSIASYNERFVAVSSGQKARGRKLILATRRSNNSQMAVGAHLQIFDEVLASNGKNNLKGARKRAVLVEAVWRKGFCICAMITPTRGVAQANAAYRRERSAIGRRYGREGNSGREARKRPSFSDIGRI